MLEHQEIIIIITIIIILTPGQVTCWVMWESLVS